MTKTETKDKGDVGLTQVIAFLELKGIKAALPLSEHLPFDLIAIDNNMALRKISVKFRALRPNGTIEIPLRTISSNSQGYKIKFANLEQIDAYAIYCPDNCKCYFIKSEELKTVKNAMSLRISDLKEGYTGDLSEINWAKDYEDPNLLFE